MLIKILKAFIKWCGSVIGFCVLFVIAYIIYINIFGVPKLEGVDGEFFYRIPETEPSHKDIYNEYRHRKSFSDQMQGAFKSDLHFNKIYVDAGSPSSTTLSLGAVGITKQDCIKLYYSRTLLNAKNAGFTEFICVDSRYPKDVYTFKLDKSFLLNRGESISLADE